ncbi:hypothetical protein F0310_04540 (plasmid) [Borrelia sp. A-FGy1]|uniref:hypothetical protein n=1 Tax=Borrelia sp. A-FGy1 TaxID=2608247 RepID=UPI0015F5425A|nr:hypothetical protein [Borrelia sp. A-FGy1]QMU99686.1 hypothetical protein F0310_04540 [Borrelia sp. A-FGy1]
MSKFNFINGLPFDLDLLNQIQDEIELELRNCSKSRHGRAIDGFSVSLDIDTKKISTTAGYGFTPEGNLVEIGDASLFIDSITDIDSVVIFIYVKEKGNLGYLYYKDVSYADPYKYSWTQDVNYKSSLVIAVVLKGRVYPLNREYQVPKFPTRSILFYGRNDFVDYISLKGCRVADELDNRFIKFAENYGQMGGNSKYRLNKSQIPSLEFKGNTDISGSHNHKYTLHRYSGQTHHWGHSYYEYVVATGSSYLSYEGEHVHTFSTLTDGTSFSPDYIDITPEYVTLVPIIREY